MIALSIILGTIELMTANTQQPTQSHSRLFRAVVAVVVDEVDDVVISQCPRLLPDVPVSLRPALSVPARAHSSQGRGWRGQQAGAGGRAR